MKQQIILFLVFSLFIFSEAASPSKFKVVEEIKKTAVVPQILAETASTSSQVTTTSRKSYGDSISDAFTGFCIGVFLIFTMPALLWFNEKRAVDIAKEIMKADEITKETPTDMIDTALDKELVHLAGETKNADEITDSFFNVSVSNSIRLKRTVYAYQVVEHVHETKERDIIGGGTTTVKHYTYNNEWRSEEVDSSRFQDSNHKNDNSKVKFIAKQEKFNGTRVTIGAHVLAKSQIEQIENFTPFTLLAGTENNLGKEAQTAIHGIGWENPQVYVEGNFIHIKHVKGSDNIGDLKVEFEFITCQPITVIAAQEGESFKPYPIKERLERDANIFQKCLEGCQGCCTTVFCYSPCCQCVQSMMAAPTEIDWVYTGEHDKKQVLKKREEENDTNTKVMRVIGLLLLIFGFYLLFAPIIAFLSIISFLGDIVAVAALIVSILVGLALGFTIIAISWIFYRPLYGLLLLSIVGGIIYFIYYASAKGAEEESQSKNSGFLQMK